ncbi:protein FAM204A isoform X2 [Coregonus clupeaformis]|uniref:protein FAM204A isoform X2 n=1 Tax=Coregonus clupeaformis TaxID=59861 RepID=UPI001BE054BE|nr:protein FAM204A isoform X2 [Coregonus clupeaformis]
MKLLKKRQQRRRHKKERQAEHEKHWDGLTQYFGINDRFQPPACSKPASKSSLEKSMVSAIAEGDFGKAEKMSDRLATRELAVKIAQATNCRDFVQSKQEVEASRAAQKRKKQIASGFVVFLLSSPQLSPSFTLNRSLLATYICYAYLNSLPASFSIISCTGMNTC